jgi:predicted DCC family thiol-disulfide oxidoreductase YuxK
MKNGWTGGQYSIFRVVFAMYLLGHFLRLPPRGADIPLPSLFPNVLALSDSAVTVTVLLTAGAVLTIFFGIGLYDRAAALGLWYVWSCLFGCNPLVSHSSLPLVGWLLPAHVFVPPAPYGSWAARGRVDPGGGWRMPPALFATAWVVLALFYASSGYTKLISPSWRDGTALARVLVRPAWLLHLATWTVIALELGFAPLALVRRFRPWLWGLMLLTQLSLSAFSDFADLGLGMVMIHLFTWDPGWIRPLRAGTERLFYDGHCGLCQRSVRLILAEDATGSPFRFAPLQGETFQALLSPQERDALPLSLVVQTEKGTLLTRSSAVLHIMRRLGGVWRLLAGVLVLLPARLRNALYDGVARIRLHIFARPAEVCPLMTPQLRARFDP